MINTTVGVVGLGNPAGKLGLKAQKEDVGQTLGSYGIGPGCYLVLPILGPSTARDSVGMIADTFVDPFAHITWRENELFGVSGNQIDYVATEGQQQLILEQIMTQILKIWRKIQLTCMLLLKSLYLQNRKNKVNNSSEAEDDWGNLDN